MQYVKNLKPEVYDNDNDNGVDGKIYVGQMTSDNQGNIIISPFTKPTLEVFNSDGDFLRTIQPLSKSKRFSPFRAVGVNSSDQIIASTEEETITIDSSGNFVGVLIESNPFVKNVAINSRDNIVMSFSKKIITFDKDGKKISEFNPRLDNLDHYCWGVYISLNSQDDIIVSDGEENSLKLFDDKGRLLEILANSRSGLHYPKGVKTNHRDEIFLVERRRNTKIPIHDIKIVSPDGKTAYTSEKDYPEGLDGGWELTVNLKNVIVDSNGEIKMFLDTR
jgi:hypothetical protein